MDFRKGTTNFDRKLKVMSSLKVIEAVEPFAPGRRGYHRHWPRQAEVDRPHTRSPTHLCGLIGTVESTGARSATFQSPFKEFFSFFNQSSFQTNQNFNQSIPQDIYVCVHADLDP